MAKQSGIRENRLSSVSTPIDVRLLSDPIVIKMAEEKGNGSESGFKVFFFTILVIIVVIIGWGVWQVLPRNVQSQQITEAGFPIQLTIDEPRNATLRDKLPITVTVQNTGSTKLTLTLSVSLDPSDVATLSEDGLTSVEVKDLPPGGVYTHTFNFLPVRPGTGLLQPTIRIWNGSAYLEKYLANSQMQVVGWPPYLRLLLTYILTTSGVAGALVGFGWERIKKALGE